MTRSRRPDRGRTAVAAAAVSLLASLLFVSAAPAAGDPVAAGQFRLQLRPSFKSRLAGEGVRMSPKSWSIKAGSLDPTSGAGTLTLKGRLRFRAEDRKLVFKKLTVKLGSGGVLKAGGVRMFRLRGSSVQRNGFGAEISAVSVKLTDKGARKLRRRLGLDSLRSMRAGRASLSEQPQTVAVTGGNLHFVPAANTTIGSGTVASKLPAHCVDFFNGNLPIPPTTKAGTVIAPFYDFPVSGGSIGPQGDDGTVELSGGLKVLNNNGSSGSCNSPPPPLAQLNQTELSYNLLDDYVSSHVVITETVAGTVPSAGDQGVGIGSNLDTSSATVSADPDEHKVTIKGIVMRINKGSALFLNQTFRQPVGHYNGALEFNSGDLFGTVDFTVSTR